MTFEIKLRGVMLLETATIRGNQYLYRILIPRARTLKEMKENWVHSDPGKARSHTAGVVRQDGTEKKCTHQPLNSLDQAILGVGSDLPLLGTSVSTGLPVVTSLVSGYELRRSAFIEILTRGSGSVQLVQQVGIPYTFDEGGHQPKPLTSFNAKIVFDDIPGHTFDHLPEFVADDVVAIYNFDFPDPTPDDLDETTQVPQCADIEDDDDFYWIYGMFAKQNGDKIPSGRLKIPVPDCRPHAGAAIVPPITPRVSSCFLGLV